MPIPQIDPDEISQGVIGVYMGILSAMDATSSAEIAYFLDKVPERGEELWQRFRAFQNENKDATFIDFITQVVATQPIVDYLYPKECLLDLTARAVFASEVLATILTRDTGVWEIYFAEDPSYTAARTITCKGCPMSECQHWLDQKGKSRRR